MIKNLLRKKEGFTLMEMLIVIFLLTLLMPTIFFIIYVLLQQQLKIKRLIETKAQGDRIMNLMKEKIIREGVMVRDNTGLARCTTANSSFNSITGVNFNTAKDTQAGANSFRFRINGTNLIVDDPSQGLNAALNDANVTISNYSISCYRLTLLSSPIIGISYRVTFNDPTVTALEGTVFLDYRTKVKLRF